jgi:hypothetical protein
MYNIRELQANEHDNWTATMQQSPQGTIFHMLDWNQMLADTDSSITRTLALICLDKKEKITAGVIIPIRSASENNSQAVTPSFGYISPFFADMLHYEERHHTYPAYAAFYELIDTLKVHAPGITLNNSPDIWDIRPYLFHNWEIKAAYTHELHRPDDNWRDVSPDLRSVIEQGKEKYKLNIDRDGKWDNVFSEANSQIDPIILKKRLAWMRSTGTGSLFVLTDSKDQAVAITLAILSQHDQRAFLWGTACLDGENEFENMPILFWQVCSELFAEFERIDLGNSKDTRTNHIKDKLGGKLLPIFNVMVGE